MDPRRDRSFWHVFRIFLRLGLTSFGGPIAHLGYFRLEFVLRRQWLDERAYADLVALCQFLPGPASSQAGFALGLSRGGLWTGLAAWLGFTLPSALLLFLFATAATSLRGPIATAAIHGLKIVAVAVVAQALWGMARSLTPDLPRIAIAALAALLVSLLATAFGQVLAIAIGALLGLGLCRAATIVGAAPLGVTLSRRRAIASLTLFLLLLVAASLLAPANHTLGVFSAFYRSGALVFGGGHVVLPLLSDAVVRPGWLSQEAFLTGYGAAQAVPGPLFTIAAYMGALLNAPPNGAVGAGLALLLFLDTLPYNAHTTASDALWAGLPLLTCTGHTFAARVAASLLYAIGLPELVTSSLVDYEALALALARDPNRLAIIKQKLTANRDTHPLFDTPRFTRGLESAYQTMWKRQASGLPPADFSVAG